MEHPGTEAVEQAAPFTGGDAGAMGFGGGQGAVGGYDPQGVSGYGTQGAGGYGEHEGAGGVPSYGSYGGHDGSYGGYDAQGAGGYGDTFAGGMMYDQGGGQVGDQGMYYDQNAFSDQFGGMGLGHADGGMDDGAGMGGRGGGYFGRGGGKGYGGKGYGGKGYGGKGYGGRGYGGKGYGGKGYGGKGYGGKGHGGKGYGKGGGEYFDDGNVGGGYGGYPPHMGGYPPRDDERERERARNGVRGLRWGGAGGQMGPIVHTPEVRRLMETINPAHFELAPKLARFFIIKSYSEDDVHKAIKYGVWASTDTGNRRLDQAYRETGSKGPLYLFFSVNASGQFSGMAQMESALDYTKKFGVWAQDKWSGTFLLKWTFIKDIPNSQFRHIVLANNENKPVTNSRDTQEVMLDQGRELLRIFHTYSSKTSILDDFGFYDKRQELMEMRAQGMGGVPGMPIPGAAVGPPGGVFPGAPPAGMPAQVWFGGAADPGAMMAGAALGGMGAVGMGGEMDVMGGEMQQQPQQQQQPPPGAHGMAGLSGMGGLDGVGSGASLGVGGMGAVSGMGGDALSQLPGMGGCADFGGVHLPLGSQGSGSPPLGFGAVDFDAAGLPAYR